MKFICMDVGTSSCKVAVINETGETLAYANRGYAMRHEREGWATLDLRVLRQNALDCLREVAPMADGARALAVSSLGETMAMLDEHDELVFGEGMTYLDCRNVQVWNTLHQDEELLYRHTGKRALHIGAMNQYAWQREHAPRELERVRRILFVDSYMAYVLSGEAAMDYSTASNSVVFDINTHQWSPELAQRFGFDLGLFPKVYGAGTPIGTLRPALAEQLGLPREVTVLAGCHDQISALVGGGAVQPGDAVLGEGSTEALNLLMDNADLPKAYANRMSIEPFLDEHSYITMHSRLTHGTCIKWFANLVRAEGEQDVYGALNRGCADSSAGLVFLPYLANTCMSGYTESMGSFIGLDAGNDRYQAYRAVLEGLSCETRLLCEEIVNAQLPFRHITATGGATKSTIYMQIKANITKRRIGVLQNCEAGLNGLAMLCAVRMGCYPDMRSAIQGFGVRSTVYEPTADASAVVRRYEATRDAILKLYRELQRV